MNPTLHPLAQALLDAQATSGEPPMENMTEQEARAIADTRVLRLTFPHRDGVSTRDLLAPGPNGPVGVAFWRLQRTHAHWELEAVPAAPSGITLNGRPVFRAALRDGDQIELSTGVVYRFRLER